MNAKTKKELKGNFAPETAIKNREIFMITALNFVTIGPVTALLGTYLL